MDVEINVDDTLLTVHINPYFLRLNFPHSLVEDDDATARYDPGTGHLTITLTKQVNGQHFPDLDLLAKLLAPRPSHPLPGPSIQVVGSESADIADISRRTDNLSLDDEFVQGALSGCTPSLQLTSFQRQSRTGNCRRRFQALSPNFIHPPNDTMAFWICIQGILHTLPTQKTRSMN